MSSVTLASHESAVRRSKLLTIRQAGHDLSCSTRTVARLMTLGELARVKLGRSVRITSASVDALIERGGVR
ncbi:MAG: helix-turn-helix domain-containing protein [Phycisphaerales bacterium]|nr:helix-turn-helix domain-containing protein [Phycisphaerales bacterium]